MNNVQYRNLEKKDLQTIKELVREAFSFNKFIHNEKILDTMLNLYIKDSILDSSFIKVAVKDDKLIGFIFSKIKNHTNIINNFFTDLNEKEMEQHLLLASDEDKREIDDFMKIKEAYEELLKGKENLFQGCINLFIVSKECRGLGVGKVLLSSSMEYMKNNKVKSMYLFTDTRCNYGFYDTHGFNHLAKKCIYLDLANETINTFLYSYNL